MTKLKNTFCDKKNWILKCYPTTPEPLSGMGKLKMNTETLLFLQVLKFFSFSLSLLHFISFLLILHVIFLWIFIFLCLLLCAQITLLLVIKCTAMEITHTKLSAFSSLFISFPTSPPTPLLLPPLFMGSKETCWDVASWNFRSFISAVTLEVSQITKHLISFKRFPGKNNQLPWI